MIRKICSFIDADDKYPIDEFLVHLEPKQQRKIKTQLKLILEQTDSLQLPHVKAFRLDRFKGLYELRTRIKQMVRIIFCISDDGTIILLHGFVKKHDRATEQALELARVRKSTLASGGAHTTEFKL